MDCPWVREYKDDEGDDLLEKMRKTSAEQSESGPQRIDSRFEASSSNDTLQA
jgi:hypothetical protein